MTNQKITDPRQYAALLDYAQRNGRHWKALLNHAWMTGDYQADDDSAALQQIRNTFGPSWLVRFRLPKVTPKHLQHSTMELRVPPGCVMRTLCIGSSDLTRRRLTTDQREAMRGLWALSKRENRMRDWLNRYKQVTQ